jgi:1,4-alpha-glucan branching enzyme
MPTSSVPTPSHSDPWKASATTPEIVDALMRAVHADPFSVLGPHAGPAGQQVVRCVQPQARQVEVIDHRGQTLAGLPMLAPGVFAGPVPGLGPDQAYQLRVEAASFPHHWQVCEDPYRFGPVLGALDLHLLAQGNHWRCWQVLGARAHTQGDVAGTAFAVWAPNAQRVSVVGSFNQWDGRLHPMRCRREAGVWEIFVPGVPHGALYKFEVLDAQGQLRFKSDPMARWTEAPPATASRVRHETAFAWTDADWMARRAHTSAQRAPIAIYEVHLGSWQRGPHGETLGYTELAERLVPYAVQMGFTHLELLPVSEHPFGGSWGYQPTALFAPSARWGDPDDLRRFIDRAHAAGLGVILDWVPAHFPSDEHGLAAFDGTALYEHADPSLGRHADWGTLIYNFGRYEVANFLIANALYWLHAFHFDGLRVDAVASMLYLDYSRPAGTWQPNVHGGRENLEAVAFLRRLNEKIGEELPGAITLAEESTSWPGVSRPTWLGGLGFHFKWNMGWMNDTLMYMSRDPIHRPWHHQLLTFGQLYAYAEQFVLPLSHDEVVHGKRSLLSKMPGDDWQRFANLRLYLSFMWTQPGKKLLFMGGEFGQWREWNHDAALDWQVLDDPLNGARHRGVSRLLTDLNALYTTDPALHQADCEAGGFEWIDCDDTAHSVLAWLRKANGDSAPQDAVMVVCNFTPVAREDYRVGVPCGGRWIERLNSDAADYGGSGAGNLGAVQAEAIPWHGRTHSVRLRLPPLAALVLLPEGRPACTVNRAGQPALSAPQ